MLEIILLVETIRIATIYDWQILIRLESIG